MKVNSIFEDLDIDASKCFSPNAEDVQAFAHAVDMKARELAAILDKNQNKGIGSREEAFRMKALSVKAKEKEALEFLQKITAMAEALDDEVLVHVQANMKDFTTAVNAMVRTAAYSQSHNDDVEEMDKKTTHMMYVRLREAYNTYKKFAEGFLNVKNLPIIPAKSGNYAQTNGSPNVHLLNIYLYTLEDGQEYFTPYVVARKLGIKIKNRMDLHDYIQSHPECGVTIKQLKG